MYLVGEILYRTIDLFTTILVVLIFARIILSWLPQFRYNQIGELIFSLTDPILVPFQRLIPPIGMLDISPMVAVIVISIARTVLVELIVILFQLEL